MHRTVSLKQIASLYDTMLHIDPRKSYRARKRPQVSLYYEVSYYEVSYYEVLRGQK